jgi:hypothetical protein
MEHINTEQKYFLPAVILGLAILPLGLGSDLLAGFEFIHSSQPHWLLFHLIATIIWLLALFMFYQRREGLLGYKHIVWNSWLTTGALVGTFFYPGIGTLAYTIALLFARFFHRQGVIAPKLISDQTGPLPAFVEVSPSLEWVAQPLVDTLENADTNARLRTVASLGRYGTSNAATLLRKLLQDPHSETRNNASVTLARLEETLSQNLRAAFYALQHNPESRACKLELANQYELYAMSGVLDQQSQKIYLQKATDLIQDLLKVESTNSELWLQVAQLCRHLGDYRQAFVHCRHALALNPRSTPALTLAMEMAFQLHAWDLFAELNQSSLRMHASSHPNWDTDFDTYTEERANHG